MPENKLVLPDDSSEVGEALDVFKYTHTTQGDVNRERWQQAGFGEDDIVVVTDTDPSPTDHGSVVRQAAPSDPKDSTASVATVAAGSTGQVDSTQISSGKTGKLLRFEASGGVPFKVELQTVLNGVATTRITRFGRGKDVEWDTPQKDFLTQVQDVGGGFDGFRLLFTNLDTGSASADFYGTFFWDEVS